MGMPNLTGPGPRIVHSSGFAGSRAGYAARIALVER